MLRRSGWVRWAPNYFRGQQNRPPAKRPARRHDSVASSRREKNVSSRDSQRSRLQNMAHGSSLAYVTPLSSRYPELLPTRERLQSLCDEAAKLLTQGLAEANDPIALSLGHPSPAGNVHGFLRFSALRDVLSPLAFVLPPPPAHMRQAGNRARASPQESVDSPRPQRLRVVPDDVAMLGGTAAPSAPPSLLPVSVLSLDELVTFLQLYDMVQCEDGELLLRLLGEVHRFIFQNIPAATTQEKQDSSPSSSSPDPLAVKLPVVQLLLVLSRLGLSEERVLQAILQKPRDGREGKGGILYDQLAHCTFAELVCLTVALHRFGFHQDYAFREATRAILRRHILRPQSDAFRFNRAVSKAVKLWDAEGKRKGVDNDNKRQSPAALTHEPFTAQEMRRLDGATRDPEVANGRNSSALTVFDTLPPLPEPLRCSTVILVEALTALSLSLFRRNDVVRALANVLVATTVEEMQVVVNSTGSVSAKRVALTAVSHKLLRAVRLCEEMHAPQPLLANCLAFSVDAARLGVVTDGGEDTDVPSERRAYYDHVTADLIKVNRSF